MCGIAGIVCETGVFDADQLRRIVTDMRDRMVHRGPDDAGVWVDPDGGCALAHRRLSIIDLSAEGRQPIGNEDGSVQVTCNGEELDIAATLKRPPEDFHADFTVPEGTYFILGDTRDSYDSRYWGPLPAEALRGRAYGGL